MVRFSHSHMSIGSFAAALGVSVVTIRRGCRSGKIKEAFRPPGGHRRFSQTLLRKRMGVGALYLTHKDRLVRFGHEIIFQICSWAGTDSVVLEEDETVSFEQERCQDVLTLMTVFSARLYGKRSHKNRPSAA